MESHTMQGMVNFISKYCSKLNGRELLKHSDIYGNEIIKLYYALKQMEKHDFLGDVKGLE